MVVQIQPGQVYEHYKGGKYAVLAIAFPGERESTQPPMVIYRSLETDSVYYREIDSFCGFTEEGVLRFAPQKSGVLSPSLIPAYLR